jgi:predicted membrane protein
LATVLTWGLYGAFLNFGAMGFEHNRIKAFLFVGVAYFLVAVLVPLAMLAFQDKGLEFLQHPEGIKWSLVAGVLGAAGALTVLFALSLNPNKGPIAASQVMAVVFAGAPIVAAIFGIASNKAGFVETALGMKWQFYLGLFMAASGGALTALLSRGPRLWHRTGIA